MISKVPVIGARHIQNGLLFWLFCLTYSMRFNLSVAIVAMTEPTSINPDVPYYLWNNKNIILSSFFLGYLVFQIPAGFLAKKFGTKRLMCIIMITNSLMVISIPIMAKWLGSEGVMACRVIQGLAQGLFFPLAADLQGKWVPTEERARVGAFLSSGSLLGLVVTYSLTGFLCKSSYGWPMSFYIFGFGGLAYSLLYIIFGCDSPAKHKSISKEERAYIEESLGTSTKPSLEVIPWKAILTSVPVWTLVATGLGQGWGTSTVISEMPTYFAKVLKFDISSNGVLSSLPYVSRFICVFFWGFSADYLNKNKYLSLTNVRKIYTILGVWGMGILLLICGFVPDSTNRYVVVGFLVASEGFHAAITCGVHVNHLDLSPNFCGILMGIMNTAEEIFSLITPICVQYIVTDETDRNQWRIVIGIGTAMLIASGIVFGMFASAERQPWNEIPNDDKKDDSEKQIKEKEAAV